MSILFEAYMKTVILLGSICGQFFDIGSQRLNCLYTIYMFGDLEFDYVNVSVDVMF